MAYKTGKSKSLDGITLSDVLQYPIWEWALDEEGVDEQDETWQRPIIDTDNVTEEIYSPTITLKIKNSNIYGSGEFDNETESICPISIWNDTEWNVLSESGISAPIIFISIPKINGVENVEFVCDDLEDEKAIKV